MTFQKKYSYGNEFSSYTAGFAWDMTVVLIALHIVSMLLCVLISATGHSSLLEYAIYTPRDLARGYWGSLFLHPLYHDIAREHIWFAIEMLMFFWFGREVERTVDRFNYGILYLLLCFVPPLVMFPLTPWLGDYALAGSNTVHFSIFLAFVILYPRAQFFFGFTAKWLGIIFMAISTLAYLSQRQWAYIFQLWCSLGIVAACLPWMKGVSIAEKFSNWKLERAERKLKEREEKKKLAEENFNTSVDHILEKISREGMENLTSEEKKQLEQARARLLKKH